MKGIQTTDNCLVTSAILLLLVTACSQTRVNTKSDLPNILFISIDDLRPELGCYGNPVIKTPNIDRLASEGVTFMQAYCQSAVCAPSRASLMTGLRPDSTRVWHLGDQFRKIKPDAVTMPQYFHKYGYYTVSIGKIFHNYMPDSISWDEPDLRPFPYGEPENLKRDGETFYELEASRIIQIKRREGIIARNPNAYADGWNCGPGIESADVPDANYIDGAQADLAVETLKRLKKKNQPFYLALGFYRPHLPFNAPKKYWDLYDRATIPLPPNPHVPDGAPVFSMNSMYELRAYAGFEHVKHPIEASLPEDTVRLLRHGYYAAVSYVDACVGKVLDALQDLDLADNTIVAIWGDHGWKLGDLGSWGKMTNYEIDTHVPLIIKAKGQRPKAKVEGLVELVDLFPTLCELAGIPVEEYLQGTSMVPVMKNPQLEWKDAVFSQFHRRPKEAYDGGRYMGYSMHTIKFHYVEWYTWNDVTKNSGDLRAVELYDLQKDPHEKINRAGFDEAAFLRDSLSNRLHRQWPHLAN